MSIITDETSDCHDQSILNVIVSICGKSFLIDVVTLRECNHQTLSQVNSHAVTHMDIAFEDIVSFVVDSTAVKKLILLLNVFINNYHVLYLANILNLGEVFSHWPAFDNITQFITFIKSAFLKKLVKKGIP